MFVKEGDEETRSDAQQNDENIDHRRLTIAL
jgi:hypothetical protein